ncbi:synaptobrevin-domain-containing protein [Pilobolus umbonatus]|nr:synaptobrevin-domain-containing protein [Pilobolus umbonatus]
MSEPYNPHIPNVQKDLSVTQIKTARIQQDINEAADIMHKNIVKAHERGEKMNTLKKKADDLGEAAKAFKEKSTKVKRRMQWKDLKWKIIIGVIILVLLGIIIGSVVGTQK